MLIREGGSHGQGEHKGKGEGAGTETEKSGQEGRGTKLTMGVGWHG